jgi:hypothetical protein
LHIVYALVAEVGGLVVEAEPGMVFHSRQGAFGGGRVKGDLGGMHLESEIDFLLGGGIENRCPAFGEIFKSLLPVFLRCWRERVNRMPD